MGRRLKKLAFGTALGVGLGFGLWSTADAALPGPDVTQVFNETATPSGERDYRLSTLKVPENTQDLWRVRLGAWDMAGGGHHTFLEFAPYSDKPGTQPPEGQIYQIHGIATDKQRHDFAVLNFWRSAAYTRYFNGDYKLKVFGVNHDHNRKFFGQTPDTYIDIYYGPKDEVLKMYLDGMKLVEDINRRDDGYSILTHNSNSVQRTLTDGLGMGPSPLYNGFRLTAIAGRVWAPGIESSLLPQSWNRDKAREEGGYGGLAGDALEKMCRQQSGVEHVWKEFKPKAPTP